MKCIVCESNLNRGSRFCSKICYQKYGTLTLSKRFWCKVDKSGDCWIWKGGKSKEGYGRFKIKGKLYGANRVSYELTNGTIQDKSLDVCHTCDNPPLC